MSEKIESITSFKSAGEYFGLNTMVIRHILERTTITNVPLAKPYYMGIVNNHGNMIPVIDFRKLIGVETDEPQPEASIIVVSVDDENTSLLGFFVDEVYDVFDANVETLDKNVVLNIDNSLTKTMKGSLKYDDKFVYLIDMQEMSNILEK